MKSGEERERNESGNDAGRGVCGGRGDGEWEFACRAGTTSAYNNGGDSEEDLKRLGRYSGNGSDGKGGYSSYQTAVGSYASNKWGLYDMHGNCWELCLDWYGDLPTNAVDYSGPSSGTGRISRGGCWGSNLSECASSHRGRISPMDRNGGQGFRVALNTERGE